MKNKLLTISGIIIAAMMALLVYQDHIISKYKGAIEEIDTTTTTTYTDTIYLDTLVVDSMPKEKIIKIIKTDTLWKINPDSTITMTPIILKKKYIQTL